MQRELISQYTQLVIDFEQLTFRYETLLAVSRTVREKAQEVRASSVLSRIRSQQLRKKLADEKKAKLPLEP